MARRVRESRARFIHELLQLKKKFDPRSFRTVVRRAHRITFGCPKGKYSPSTELCKVPVQIQKILHPMAEAMLSNPCPLSNPKKRFRIATVKMKERRGPRGFPYFLRKMRKPKRNPRKDITIEKEATRLFSQGVGVGTLVEHLKKKYRLSTDMARYFARRAGAVTRGARKYIASGVRRSILPMVLNPRKKWYVGICKFEGKPEVFSSSKSPTRKSHGSRFSRVYGPFNSSRDAWAKYLLH